jgi:hypothetical protein
MAGKDEAVTADGMWMATMRAGDLDHDKLSGFQADGDVPDDLLAPPRCER